MIRLLLRLLSWLIGLITGPDELRDFPPGFDTPEGAVLMLEAAYRAKDIEAAVACKDFDGEAKVMLRGKALEMSGDPEIVRRTAEVLELAYRTELAQTGFPNLEGVTSRFRDRYEDLPDLATIREECTYPDGTTSRQRINVRRTDAGWRVLNAW
jgi:hypothetical protein